MSTKIKSIISPGGSIKKHRKTVDFEMKMKIITDYEAGKKVKAIARDVGLAHSTVSTILKDKDRIKEAVKASIGLKAVITRQRKGLIHEMEKLLAAWFDDQVQKKIPMSFLIIRAKARSIFEMLKQHEGEQCTETFTASQGWFQRFRRRFNLHNRNNNGEVANADNLVVEVEDIENLVEYTEGELTNDYLIELEAQQRFQEEEEKTEEKQKNFTVKGLANVFSKVNMILLELESMDPNIERFTKVQNEMNKILQCYREIYEEKNKLQSRPR